MAITLKSNPAEDTQTDLSTGKNRERDDFQKSVDGTVDGVVKAWEAAGNPEPITQEDGSLVPNPAAPSHRYTVDKADRTAMKQVIRRAATLYKVAPVWYKDAAHADGSVTIKFSLGPLPVKAGTPAETPAPAEAGTPAETPAPAEGRRGFARR